MVTLSPCLFFFTDPECKTQWSASTSVKSDSLLQAIINHVSKYILVSDLSSFSGLTLRSVVVMPQLARRLLLMGVNNSWFTAFLHFKGLNLNKKFQCSTLIVFPLLCTGGDNIAHDVL